MDEILRSMLSGARRWRAMRAVYACDRVGEGAQPIGVPFIKNRGRIDIGQRFQIVSQPVVAHVVVEDGGRLVIGNDVRVSHGCGIACSRAIEIGDRVFIGPFTLMMDTDYHVAGDPTALPQASPIKIGNDVRVGRRVVVLRGSQIGDGATVLDGSVVSGAVAAGSTVRGVPARSVNQNIRCDADADVSERVAHIAARTFRLATPPSLDQGPGQIGAWDSLGSLSFILAVEEEFDVVMPQDDFASATSLSRVVEIVEDALRR